MAFLYSCSRKSFIGLAQKTCFIVLLNDIYLPTICNYVIDKFEKGHYLLTFTKQLCDLIYLLAAHKKCYVLISSENICCTAPKSPFFSSPLLSVKSSVQFMVCIEDPLLGSSLMIIELLSSHQLWNPSFPACLAA